MFLRIPKQVHPAELNKCYTYTQIRYSEKIGRREVNMNILQPIKKREKYIIQSLHNGIVCINISISGHDIQCVLINLLREETK